MLISHRFKFIYTKTAKTAGTSVESYFERFCMPEGEWTPAHNREEYESETGIIGYRGKDPKGKKWYNHMPASRIKELVGEEVWNSYFKFCIVRNPWEKVISAFEHFGRNHPAPGGLRSWILRLRGGAMTAEQVRFYDWLRSGGAPIDRDKYLIGGRVVMDDFIRFETLQQDAKRICGRLGLPWEESQLPRYKAGLRRPETTIETIFTPASKALVARMYDFEIKHFGYTFEGEPDSRES